MVVSGLGLRDLARSGTGGRRIGALALLRLTTATVAWVTASQPVWLGERLLASEGRLAVLFDTSRSMAIAPPSGSSRADAAVSVAERWGGDPITRVFRFGETLEPTTFRQLTEQYEPTQDASRIAQSLQALVDGDQRGELGAVVVVSDGADPALAPALEGGGLVDRLGVKVHAVSVGGEVELDDDSIVELEADRLAFLRQEARVRVAVRSFGRTTERIPVQLRRGAQVVREEVVTLDEEGYGQIEFGFTPERLGRQVYRVTIPIRPGDAVADNNERAFLVRVGREKLRALLVAGQPSWDERFLRSFLERDPAIDLISFFILRTASDLTMASPDELALIPFPTDELFSEHLGSFDLVIFQNFDFAPYQMAGYLPGIRDYVRRGGAFAMIGGELSFAGGGYGETAIADILPVQVGASSSDAVIEGRFRPEPVASFARHPLLELLPNPGQNARAWSELAPLEGANRLEGIRGDGQVLLQHPTARVNGVPAPILVVGTAERGRTLALASDTSYRWGITTGGQTGDVSAYERFWDRVLRWLTRDPSLEPARLTTDRERYGPGAVVSVEGVLRNQRFEPLAGEEVELSIVTEAGDTVVETNATVDRDGHVAVTLEGPELAGGYRVVARSPAGAIIAEEGFVVEAGGDELADPRARPGWLERLADASGGQFYRAQDAVALRDFDTTRTRSIGYERSAPFESPLWFVVTLSLFASEWVLRRRWGRR